MAELSISVDIDAAPDRVWAVLTDVERWPGWTASISSIERLAPGPLVVGSRVRIRQPKLLPAVWTVIEITKDRSLTWTTCGLGFSVSGFHRIEPSNGGARVTLSVTYSGVLGRLMERLTRNLTTTYVAIEAAGLKQRSESEGPPGQK